MKPSSVVNQVDVAPPIPATLEATLGLRRPRQPSRKVLAEEPPVRSDLRRQ
jgi:hypothetical protein